MNRVVALIKLLRIEQWIKNSFVMAGVVFAGKLTDFDSIVLSIKATLVFCLASSAVYSFNDCFDYQSDRKHPVKKLRPIAKNDISIGQGALFSVFLSIITILLAYFSINLIFFTIIIIYLLSNLLYSIYLKKVILVDVFMIAFGFMLRMIAGTMALSIPPSHWIIICTMMISLFLGFCKRYAEFKNQSKEEQKYYSKDFLMLLIGVSCSCTIMTYGLYTINADTVNLHGSNYLIYSLPMVIYGLFRYIYIVLSDQKGGAPSKEIFADTHIFIAIIVYFLFILMNSCFNGCWIG